MRPTFVADKRGTYVVQLVVNDGIVDSPADSVMITTENSAPVADAGGNQSVVVTTTVQLDGSASTDIDGDALTFYWTLTSIPAGSLAQLSDPNRFNPSFVVDKPGVYVAQLVATDGETNSAPATVTITTENSAPKADSGPDQSVALNGAVTLDGRNSTDVDGDPLQYEWSVLSKPENSQANLQNPTAAQPSFVADKAGMYVIGLVPKLCLGTPILEALLRGLSRNEWPAKQTGTFGKPVS